METNAKFIELIQFRYSTCHASRKRHPLKNELYDKKRLLQGFKLNENSKSYASDHRSSKRMSSSWYNEKHGNNLTSLLCR